MSERQEPMSEPPARPLRLCLLSEGFYPEVMGGMELHAYQLAERLWDRGVRCEVLARPVDPATPRDRHVGRIRIRHMGVAGQFKGKGARAVLPLAAFAGRYAVWLARHGHRFDAVMALGSKTTPLPAFLAGPVSRLPLVLVPQTASEFAEPISADSLAQGGMAAGLLRPWRRLRTAVLRRADAVVAISAEVAHELQALGVPEARIVRIPNGIDVERFSPVPPARREALRAELGLPAGRALFAFVGRLSRAKGLIGLTQAWATIAARHPDAHLVLVGGGGSVDDCEAELRALAATPGLAGSVTLTGATEQVSAYLQAADAFVFPSEHEGFGLALLEAMACGLPVVTTRVGVAPEIVREPAMGRLVPIRDTPTLVQALDELCARRADWPEMGAAARSAVAEHYGIDAVADRYVHLLRQLAARRVAARPSRGGAGPP